MQAVAMMQRDGETAAAKPGNARMAAAMLLYGGLLVAVLLTLSDWRIRLVTAAIVLLFAGRTLWAPRKDAPSPVGRDADRQEEDSPM
ncbi:MAG: hypothetical protein ACRD1Y_09290 [Terriglobales bacterium]